MQLAGSMTPDIKHLVHQLWNGDRDAKVSAARELAAMAGSGASMMAEGLPNKLLSMLRGSSRTDVFCAMTVLFKLDPSGEAVASIRADATDRLVQLISDGGSMLRDLACCTLACLSADRLCCDAICANSLDAIRMLLQLLQAPPPDMEALAVVSVAKIVFGLCNSSSSCASALDAGVLPVLTACRADPRRPQVAQLAGLTLARLELWAMEQEAANVAAAKGVPGVALTARRLLDEISSRKFFNKHVEHIEKLGSAFVLCVTAARQLALTDPRFSNQGNSLFLFIVNRSTLDNPLASMMVQYVPDEATSNNYVDPDVAAENAGQCRRPQGALGLRFLRARMEIEDHHDAVHNPNAYRCGGSTPTSPGQGLRPWTPYSLELVEFVMN